MWWGIIIIILIIGMWTKRSNHRYKNNNTRTTHTDVTFLSWMSLFDSGSSIDSNDCNNNYDYSDSSCNHYDGGGYGGGCD